MRPWSARAVLLGLVFAVIGGLQTNLTFQTSILLDGGIPVYAAVVSWFCLEVAIISASNPSTTCTGTQPATRSFA